MFRLWLDEIVGSGGQPSLFDCMRQLFGVVRASDPDAFYNRDPKIA
jgi:hypothetical protein